MVAATVSLVFDRMSPVAKRRSAVMFFGSMAGTDGAASFVPIPIQDIAAAIFDGPLVAVEAQHGLGIGGLRGMAGDAVHGFSPGFTGFLVEPMSLDDEGLTDAWKIEVVVETGGRPDGARFDPAMSQGGWRAEAGFAALFEERADRLGQRAGWFSLRVKT